MVDAHVNTVFVADFAVERWIDLPDEVVQISVVKVL